MVPRLEERNRKYTIRSSIHRIRQIFCKKIRILHFLKMFTCQYIIKNIRNIGTGFTKRPSGRRMGYYLVSSLLETAFGFFAFLCLQMHDYKTKFEGIFMPYVQVNNFSVMLGWLPGYNQY